MKENEMHFINTHTCISVDQPGMLAAHVSVLLDTKKKLLYYTWQLMAY
jgi:hypothetical protein